MNRIFIAAFVCGIAALSPAKTIAGGGHLHGYSGGDENHEHEEVVLLGSDAITNLQIRVDEVHPSPPLVARLGGVVKRLADAVVTVAAPANGSLTKIVVQPGAAVERGKVVALFSPFQVGSGSLPLLSPIDGVMGAFEGALGAGHDIGAPLFTVVDPRRLGLVVPLTRVNQDLPLKLGDAVTISIAGDPARFEGRVYSRESGSVSDNGVGYLTLELLPRGGVLPPLGASGSLSIVATEGAPVIHLPREAVVGTVAAPVVFVRRGNRFERRSIVIAREIGERVEISRGVSAHERVVVQGAYQLNLARSDSPKKLTVGPHGGVVANCISERGERSSAEIKLHDDKGDIELWLSEGESLERPLYVPISSKVSLRFVGREKTVALAVRDERTNNDEDGKPHIQDGRADYFIFPGESGADAGWLTGADFIEEAALAVDRGGNNLVCDLTTVVPHSHGGGGHTHGDHGAEHAHDHADDHGHDHSHGHDHGHDHDHGGGHSH